MPVTGDTSCAFSRRLASGGHKAIVAIRKLARSVLRDLKVRRPAHRADAGRAVGQGNEPEPAVIEPEQHDIAFGLARGALRAGEMAEDRRAGMLGVAALDVEAARQQRVPPGCIDEKFGAPAALLPAGVAPARNHAAFRRKIDRGDPAFLDDFGAFGGGVLQQDMVEFGAAHLIGVGKALVPPVGELEARRSVVVEDREKLGAVFGHADPGDLRLDTEPLEQRQVERQQRLADMEARVLLLLHEHDALAALRQQRRDRRSRRTAADHQHITHDFRQSGGIVGHSRTSKARSGEILRRRLGELAEIGQILEARLLRDACVTPDASCPWRARPSPAFSGRRHASRRGRAIACHRKRERTFSARARHVRNLCRTFPTTSLPNPMISRRIR